MKIEKILKEKQPGVYADLILYKRRYAFYEYQRAVDDFKAKVFDYFKPLLDRVAARLDNFDEAIRILKEGVSSE